MLLLPEICLKDGKVECPEAWRAAAASPPEIPEEAAMAFYNAGARYFYIVDLDAVRHGIHKNEEIIRAIARLGIKIQLKSHIQSIADLEAVFALGIWRAVINFSPDCDPALVQAAVKQFGPERIAVEIAARDGLVSSTGPGGAAAASYLSLARSAEQLGVKHIIFTNAGLDGSGSTPSYARLKFLQDAVGCSITASNGASCNADLRALRRMGLDGVIVGKALYIGAVDIRRAVAEDGCQ